MKIRKVIKIAGITLVLCAIFIGAGVGGILLSDLLARWFGRYVQIGFFAVLIFFIVFLFVWKNYKGKDPDIKTDTDRELKPSEKQLLEDLGLTDRTVLLANKFTGIVPDDYKTKEVFMASIIFQLSIIKSGNLTLEQYMMVVKNIEWLLPAVNVEPIETNEE